jgi:hypothetical protein
VKLFFYEISSNFVYNVYIYKNNMVPEKFQKITNNILIIPHTSYNALFAKNIVV